MILNVSTANLEPWALSGGTAPVFLNFRFLCKSAVTRHAQDNLGQNNESPVPAEYKVSCAPNTVSHFVPLFLIFLLLSLFPLFSFTFFFYLFFLLVLLASCIIFIYLIYFIVLILVNDQLYAQLFFSYICLFQFSTCFEQPSAHLQESQLYQYDLWYVSLYVGDRLGCRFGWNLHTTRSPT